MGTEKGKGGRNDIILISFSLDSPIMDNLLISNNILQAICKPKKNASKTRNHKHGRLKSDNVEGLKRGFFSNILSSAVILQVFNIKK